MTILIAFHLSGMRNLKHFCVFYVKQHLKEEFPCLVSYNRFVELQQKTALPLVLFLKICRMGNCTGISFMDSTALKACHIKREYSNRVFDGMPTKGKTQGNVDDRHPLSMESFISRVSGKLYADRGYVSQKLAEILFVEGIHFVAKMRNNMKGGELPLQDRVMIRKSAVIESVNDKLKNICQIEHTRHRCFANFITNLVAGLPADSFLPKKPFIRVDFVDDKQLMLFLKLYRTHVNLNNCKSIIRR